MYLREKKITPNAIEAIRLARNEGVLVGTHSWGGETQWRELIKIGFRMFHTQKPEAFVEFLKNK
ncbi:hypothetical protein OAK15_02890 [Verrucomicrobia bacterium]|nr:hypothetical protein [Verrucomicrobiota bacterium]